MGWEWEYEYEQNETEDFYFTLDLTTHVPDAVSKKSRSRTLREKTASTTPGRQPSNGAVGDQDELNAGEPSRMQVLGLHTTNPYIKFDHDVYSCYWMTDLGTQFYVSKPGITGKPLRPGNVLDVVGISQTRLLGKPVTLIEREDWIDQGMEGVSSANPVELEDGEDGEYVPTSAPRSSFTPVAGQPLAIPRGGRIKDKAMEHQASFLERLSAIKLKKGENDVIPVAGVKSYMPPANKDEIREKALAAELEISRAEAEEARAKQPPRRKKRTYAELGNQTIVQKAKRLREMTGSHATPGLLLPRSQSSIRSSFDDQGGPRAPMWPSPTVQRDDSDRPPLDPQNDTTEPRYFLTTGQQSDSNRPPTDLQNDIDEPSFSSATVQYDTPNYYPDPTQRDMVTPGPYYGPHAGMYGTYDHASEPSAGDVVTAESSMATSTAAFPNNGDDMGDP